MIGFNLYESVSAVEMAIAMIYFLVIILTILLMKKFLEFIPGNEYIDPRPEPPLCQHCRYRRVIDSGVVTLCNRYEPKPIIQLRKRKLACPVESNQFNISRKARFMKQIRKNSKIITIILLIVLLYLFVFHETILNYARYVVN